MVGLANWTSQSGMQAGDTPWLMQGANSAINKGVGNLKDGITGLYGQLQQNNSDNTMASLLSGAHSYSDIQNKIAANPGAFATLTPQGRKDVMALQSGFDQHDLTGAQIGREGADTAHIQAETAEMPKRLDLYGQQVANEGLSARASANAAYAEATLRRQQMSDAATRMGWATQDRNAGLGAAQVQGSLNDTAGYQKWQLTHPGGTLSAYKYDVLSGIQDPRVKALVYNNPGTARFLESAAGPDPVDSMPYGASNNKIEYLPADDAVARQAKDDLNATLDTMSKNNEGVMNDHRQLAKYDTPNMNRDSAIASGLTDDDMAYARGLGLTGNDVYKGAYLRQQFAKKYGDTMDEATRQAYIRHNLGPQAETARNEIYSQQAHVDALRQRYAHNVAFISAGLKHAAAFRGSSVITPGYNAQLSAAIDENKQIEKDINAGIDKLHAARKVFDPDAPIARAYSSVQNQIPFGQRDIGKTIGYSPLTGVGMGY